MEDKTKPTAKASKDTQDVILDLNFVPQWARKPPGENHYSDREYSDRDRRRESRGDHRGPRDSAPRRSSPRPDRPREPRRDSRPPSNRPARAPFKELPLKVSFLPEQKWLASLVRQIHHSHRAYPLMDLAHLILQDSSAYLVKIEVEKNAPDFSLYQCKCCKAVAESEEMIIQHIKSTHLEDYYEKEAIEGEPPTGQFVCVSRCRKSGVLLGPPNHHSYTDKLNELHLSRFSHMTLDEYKQNIETVRDPELIEQWKEESRHKIVYKDKENPEAEPLEQQKAELTFSKRIPSLYEETQRAIIPSTIAQKLEDQNVTRAIRRVWQKESHFPITLSFSMRAAFRHMHLHLFKAGKINFVTHIKSHPIKPEDTIESIGDVLRFLKEHPGSTRQQLVEGLRPSAEPNSPEVAEVIKPLGWLIERGHIIEFFNGTLSVPLGRQR